MARAPGAAGDSRTAFLSEHDERRFPGLTLGALSDYAALLALTEPASGVAGPGRHRQTHGQLACPGEYRPIVR